MASAQLATKMELLTFVLENRKKSAVKHSIEKNYYA